MNSTTQCRLGGEGPVGTEQRYDATARCSTRATASRIRRGRRLDWYTAPPPNGECMTKSRVHRTTSEFSCSKACSGPPTGDSSPPTQLTGSAFRPYFNRPGPRPGPGRTAPAGASRLPVRTRSGRSRPGWNGHRRSHPLGPPVRTGGLLQAGTRGQPRSLSLPQNHPSEVYTQAAAPSATTT
jgi:hypothetical protein